MLDSEGELFWDPEADQAMFDAIKEHVREGIEVVEMDANINDPERLRWLRGSCGKRAPRPRGLRDEVAISPYAATSRIS